MRKLIFLAITILFSLGIIMSCKPSSKEVPLISRDVLFGNPDKASLQISPDGKYISFLATGKSRTGD